MTYVRALVQGRIETQIAKNRRSSGGRSVLVLALTLPLLCLCLLPAGVHAQTSDIPLSELPPGPTSGTLPNGVGFEVNVGSAHPSQGYVFTPAQSPQIWTFDQPVSLRFGLRGLNGVGECFVVPAEAVVESIHPSHTWNPDTRQLCRGSGSESGDSIFTIAGPVTELVLEAVGTPGFGRGPGFIQVTLQTDLGIEKLAQVLDANQVRFTLTVPNNGPADATDVTVVDELPACTTHVSNDCGAAVAGSEVTWTIGDLANGSAATCNILVDATACIGMGLQTNTATVEAAQDETDPDNNTATAEFELAASPAITLDKTGSGPDPLTVGATIDYTFLITNTGNVTLSDVTVTDPLPRLSPISCPSDTLAPGAEMTCTATYTVTQADVDAGVIENTGTVTGQPPGGLPPPTDESSTTFPPTGTPGISIEKSGSGPDPLTVGATIDYSFEVENTGNVTLTNVTITDPLPGLSPIDCPTSTLAPGAAMTCTATYTVTQADVDAGMVENTATVTGETPTGQPPPSDESTTTVPPTPPVPALPLLAGLLLALLLSLTAMRRLRRSRA